MLWSKSPTSFFCRWLSSFPSNICWGNNCFPIECSWYPHWKWICHRFRGLFLDCQFHSTDQHLSLCQYYTDLITVALYCFEIKQSRNVSSPILIQGYFGYSGSSEIPYEFYQFRQVSFLKFWMGLQWIYSSVLETLPS